VTDPNSANDSATDTDTLVASADVNIGKTDLATTETVGTPVTYFITVGNNGPSTAPVTVVDNFPAALSGCSTTCAPSGGATCTAGPTAGNINDSITVPAGGQAVYTSTCNISASAYGNLVNTATATVTGGVTDPSSANNTSTDTDLLNSIFIDGFESGDTSQWSSDFPFAGFRVFAKVGVDAGSSEVTFAYDLGSVRPGRDLEATGIVELASASGEIVARIVARRQDAASPLELRLEVVGGARSAWVAADAGTQAIRIDWATANAISLGSISSALDGVVTLWVEGFAPAGAPAAVNLLRERVAP
jgi:hypothetical protein